MIVAPRLDLKTGAIRLQRTTFHAALSYALGRSDSRHGEQLEALRTAALLDGGALHPDLMACLAPVMEPVCSLALRHDASRSEGWVSSSSATLLVPADSELWDLVRMHPSFLPEALARMAGLSPREGNREAKELLVSEAWLESLVRSGDGARADDPVLGGGQADAAAADLAELRGSWEARCRWSTGKGTRVERRLEVLDCADTIWYVYQRSPDVVRLRRATSTVIWRELTRLLPSDSDFGDPSADLEVQPVGVTGVNPDF